MVAALAVEGVGWILANLHTAAERVDEALTEAFASDPLRQERLSIWAPEIFADFSKALVDMPVMGLLQQLARGGRMILPLREAGADAQRMVLVERSRLGLLDLLLQEAQKLGLARADAVRDYLYKQHGVPLFRINTISFGAEKPAGDNKTKEGRAQNRRVVLIVMT